MGLTKRELGAQYARGKLDQIIEMYLWGNLDRMGLFVSGIMSDISPIKVIDVRKETEKSNF